MKRRIFFSVSDLGVSEWVAGGCERERGVDCIMFPRDCSVPEGARFGSSEGWVNGNGGRVESAVYGLRVDRYGRLGTRVLKG